MVLNRIIGESLVEEAMRILEKISNESGDNDLRVIAEEALFKIKRVVGIQKN